MAATSSESNSTQLIKKSKLELIQEEFLNTEKIYLEYIQEILPKSDEKSPFQDMEKILKEKVPELYQLETLIKLHQQIDADLKKENPKEPLETVFLRYSEYFKIYSEYLANYNIMREKISALEKENSTVASYFQLKKQARSDNLGIQDLMIKPVQRIMKYPLLLTEILSRIQEGDPRRANFGTLLQKMAAIALKINEDTRSAEKIQNQKKLEAEKQKELQIKKTVKSVINDKEMQAFLSKQEKKSYAAVPDPTVIKDSLLKIKNNNSQNNVDINIDLLKNHPQELALLLKIVIRNNKVPNLILSNGQKITNQEGVIQVGKALGLEDSEIYNIQARLAMEKINQEMAKKDNIEEIDALEEINKKLLKLIQENPKTKDSIDALKEASNGRLSKDEVLFEVVSESEKKEALKAVEMQKEALQNEMRGKFLREDELKQSPQSQENYEQFVKNFTGHYNQYVKKDCEETQYLGKDKKLYEKGQLKLRQEYDIINEKIKKGQRVPIATMIALNNKARDRHVEKLELISLRNVLKTEIKKSIKENNAQMKSTSKKADREFYKEKIHQKKKLLKKLKNQSKKEAFKEIEDQFGKLNRSASLHLLSKKNLQVKITTKIELMVAKMNSKDVSSADKKYYQSNIEKLNKIKKNIDNLTPGSTEDFKKEMQKFNNIQERINRQTLEKKQKIKEITAQIIQKERELVQKRPKEKTEGFFTSFKSSPPSEEEKAIMREIEKLKETKRKIKDADPAKIKELEIQEKRLEDKNTNNLPPSIIPSEKTTRNKRTNI